MTITVTKFPNIYSFLGNSIAFELLTDVNDLIDVEIISAGISKFAAFYPFRKGSQYQVRMNLSDYLSFDTESTIPEGYIISPLSGFCLPYQIKIGSGYIFDGFVFRGGISNYAFKILSENGYDIFTYRLASYSDQFLFTTRTNLKEIRLKETELYPFVFIHPGLSIVFRSELGNEITTAAQPAGTICVMDIKEVLAQMPAGTKRINICPGGNYSFHFVIEPGKISEEKYLIRFRNSLSAFEIVEVTGRAMHAPEFGEENTCNVLTDFDCYEERRSRLKTKRIIEVETGHKDRRELPFILDLIKSDESYFIYPDRTSFRCIVSADDVKFKHMMTEPTSFLLTVKEVIEEDFSTPPFEFTTDDAGIFDDFFE